MILLLPGSSQLIFCKRGGIAIKAVESQNPVLNHHFSIHETNGAPLDQCYYMMIHYLRHAMYPIGIQFNALIGKWIERFVRSYRQHFSCGKCSLQCPCPLFYPQLPHFLADSLPLLFLSLHPTRPTHPTASSSYLPFLSVTLFSWLTLSFSLLLIHFRFVSSVSTSC